MRSRLVKICRFFFLLLLIVIGATGASYYRVVSGPVSHHGASTPDFGNFAGSWFAHSSSLVLSNDGTATFVGRTYSWCGPGVAQPCDTIDERGSIHPGIQEQMQFSRASGSTAYGTIISSNFQAPGLTVTIELQPNDTLLYKSDTLIALLCGPNAPVGTCGA